MAQTMKCKVVSAETSLYEGNVQMVVASGDLGDLGITPGHTPLITSLKAGPVRLVYENGTEELFFVSGGFLEALPFQVTVLADTAERAEDLDEAAALRSQKEAKRLLIENNSEFDYSRAAVELSQAAARLRVIEQLRRRRA